MPALTLDCFKVPLPVFATEVKCPEFGEGSTAWIAELTAQERETRIEAPWRAMKKQSGTDGGLRQFLVAACLCKGSDREFMVPETGVPILAEQLGGLPVKALDRLYFACERANGIDDKGQQELEKN